MILFIDDGGGGGGGGDPDFADVTLLLHFDGTNGSTTFTDNSSFSRTPTVVGNAQISTAQSVFGGASGLFDGSGDYLSFAGSTDWDFGTGDFTIECWIRPNTISTLNWILGRGNSSVTGFLDYYVFTDGALYTNLYLDGGGVITINSPASSIAANTWYHTAFVRDGTNFYQYINGVSQGTPGSSSASSRDGNGATMVVGAFGLGSTFFHNGYIDDLRITKGTCRYPGGTTFTPPTAAFPDS